MNESVGWHILCKIYSKMDGIFWIARLLLKSFYLILLLAINKQIKENENQATNANVVQQR